jgi:hypothetical protein
MAGTILNSMLITSLRDALNSSRSFVVFGNVVLLKPESNSRDDLRRIKSYPDRLLAVFRGAPTFLIFSQRIFNRLLRVFRTYFEGC